MRQARRDRPYREDHAEDNPALSNVVERNIRTIVDFHAKPNRDPSSHDRIADAFTSLSGRMVFVIVHMLVFGAWIALNTGHTGWHGFDPFPFGFLDTIATLEAIVIATLVLISQNRLSDEAKHRDDLALQMGLLTEHEVTRVLNLLDRIQGRLGIKPNPDGTLADLQMETNPEGVSAELERPESQPVARTSADT